MPGFSRRPKMLRRLSGALALACAVAAFPRATLALGTNAAIDILAPISIEELDNLAFGSIVPPSSGTQKFKIDEATGGTAITGAGTGGAFITGNHRGRYSISGANGAGYTLTSSTGSCTDAVNLQLTSIAVEYVGTLNEIPVYVGGTLQVKSTVSPGNYTCGYTLSANY